MDTIRRIVLFVMIAALCVGGMALAEEETAVVTAHDYLGEWVDQDGTTNIDVEAREEGDGYVFNVQMDTFAGEAFDYNVWAYGCVYDEETGSMKSISRVTGIGSFEPDSEEEITDMDFEYADAEFFFDEAGRLIWSDANETTDDGMEFTHTLGWTDPDYVGPGHHFVGNWEDDRVSITILETMENYRVVVFGSGSAFDGAIWMYTCDYDAGTDSLVSNGELAEKVAYTYSEDGSEYNQEEIYSDGEAVFSLNEDGQLVWDDRKENAGEGRAFERAPEEETAEATGSMIVPMDPGFDLAAPGDGEYPAAFEPSALADGALTFSVYSEDVYDIVDISNIAVGDTIMVGGMDFVVETIDKGDDLLINADEDGNGITLRAYDEDNCWKVVMEDDHHTHTYHGKATLPLADDVTFTDGWDIEKEPVTVSGAEAVAEAITGTEMDYFSPLNTLVRVESGMIVEIIREYIP